MTNFQDIAYCLVKLSTTFCLLTGIEPRIAELNTPRHGHKLRHSDSEHNYLSLNLTILFSGRYLFYIKRPYSNIMLILIMQNE